MMESRNIRRGYGLHFKLSPCGKQMFVDTALVFMAGFLLAGVAV
jgi:hypothetical protein